MADTPIPSVVAMLICDQAITEQNTNKKTLIGIFENLASADFPVSIPRASIYIKLADAQGDYTFKLRIVKLKDESLISEVEAKATILDVSQYAELVLNMVNMPIPEPGKYEFQLYAQDIYLHRVMVTVLKLN
jgi:hypothetical protein